MVWFYVDDNLAFHPKVIAAGNCAMGLWVRSGAWSTGALSDGYMPPNVVGQMGTQKQVHMLVQVGLWITDGSGYRFHEWNRRQLSKVDIEAKRIYERERKAEQRKRKRVPEGLPPRDSDDIENGCPQGTVSRDSSRARALPRPAPPHSGYLGEGQNGEYDPAAPPPQCPRHGFDYDHDEPCRHCQRIREWNETSEAQATVARAAARRAAIDACPVCDDSGLRETPHGVTRCTHEVIDA
jgi:hypothetical protein